MPAMTQSVAGRVREAGSRLTKPHCPPHYTSQWLVCLHMSVPCPPHLHPPATALLASLPDRHSSLHLPSLHILLTVGASWLNAVVPAHLVCLYVLSSLPAFSLHHANCTTTYQTRVQGKQTSASACNKTTISQCKVGSAVKNKREIHIPVFSRLLFPDENTLTRI